MLEYYIKPARAAQTAGPMVNRAGRLTWGFYPAGCLQAKPHGGIFVTQNLSICLTGLEARFFEIAGVVHEALYHPELIDRVRFIGELDPQFDHDRTLDPPTKLIKQTLGVHFTPAESVHFQIHNELGNIGALLIIQTGKNQSAVMLLQREPGGYQLDILDFEIVRQAVMVTLATRGPNLTSFCRRNTLDRWLKFAQDTWGEKSEPVRRLTPIKARQGRPPERGVYGFYSREEALKRIIKAIEGFEKSARKRPTQTDIGLILFGYEQEDPAKVIRRICKEFGIDWKKLKS